MKKILGISGSPNLKGNTAFAVNQALLSAAEEGCETRFVPLAGKVISPCIGCFKCQKTRECFRRDSMDEIIEALLWCDGLIIGSPVYFGMLSGQLKVMMDRCVCLRPEYGEKIPLEGKIAGAIACANSRNGGQELTIQNIQTFFLQMNMRVVSDGPSYSHSGGTIMASAPDDVWGLETVRNLAKNIVRMSLTPAYGHPSP